MMNCQEAIDRMDEVLEGVGAVSCQNFQEHIRVCAPCRNYLEQLRLTREALRRLSGDRAPNPKRQELIDRFREDG